MAKLTMYLMIVVGAVAIAMISAVPTGSYGISAKEEQCVMDQSKLFHQTLTKTFNPSTLNGNVTTTQKLPVALFNRILAYYLFLRQTDKNAKIPTTFDPKTRKIAPTCVAFIVKA